MKCIFLEMYRILSASLLSLSYVTPRNLISEDSKDSKIVIVNLLALQNILENRNAVSLSRQKINKNKNFNVRGKKTLKINLFTTWQ